MVVYGWVCLHLGPTLLKCWMCCVCVSVLTFDFAEKIFVVSEKVNFQLWCWRVWTCIEEMVEKDSKFLGIEWS